MPECALWLSFGCSSCLLTDASCLLPPGRFLFTPYLLDILQRHIPHLSSHCHRHDLLKPVRTCLCISSLKKPTTLGQNLKTDECHLIYLQWSVGIHVPEYRALVMLSLLHRHFLLFAPSRAVHHIQRHLPHLPCDFSVFFSQWYLQHIYPLNIFTRLCISVLFCSCQRNSVSVLEGFMFIGASSLRIFSSLTTSVSHIWLYFINYF